MLLMEKLLYWNPPIYMQTYSKKKMSLGWKSSPKISKICMQMGKKKQENQNKNIVVDG